MTEFTKNEIRITPAMSKTPAAFKKERSILFFKKCLIACLYCVIISLISDLNILCYDLAVKHVDHTVCVACIMLGVCYHNNCCTLLVQIGQQLHYIISVP